MRKLIVFPVGFIFVFELYLHKIKVIDRNIYTFPPSSSSTLNSAFCFIIPEDTIGQESQFVSVLSFHLLPTNALFLIRANDILKGPGVNKKRPSPREGLHYFHVGQPSESVSASEGGEIDRMPRNGCPELRLFGAED
jgi:hypothetical protein